MDGEQASPPQEGTWVYLAHCCLCKCVTGACINNLLDSPEWKRKALDMHTKAAKLKQRSKEAPGAQSDGLSVFAPVKKWSTDDEGEIDDPLLTRTRSRQADRRSHILSWRKELDGFDGLNPGKERICEYTRSKLLCCSQSLLSASEKENAKAKIGSIQAEVDMLDARWDKVEGLHISDVQLDELREGGCVRSDSSP